MQRLEKLRSLFLSAKIDALIVSRDVNIRYLTDFPASESWLLVTPAKAYYLTDFRYIEEAKMGLPASVKLIQYKSSLAQTVFDLARQDKIKRIGFESSHAPYNQYEKMNSIVPKGMHLKPVLGLVEKIRVVKEKAEIDLMRQALRIHWEALQRMKRWIKPGLTERDVLKKLEDFVRLRNAGFSFPPIIASGPNGALPHARPTDRKIRRNEPVLVDTGIDWKGYKSDLTRMFFLDRMPTLVREVNDFVKEAQVRAIKAIKPGVKASDVDAAARGFLAKQKLDQYFGHSLGHGVGLDIHEEPRLSQTSSAILEPGMVVTVEPAVYLPGKFGIRLEEMVLVTHKGCEVLSEHYH